MQEIRTRPPSATPVTAAPTSSTVPDRLVPEDATRDHLRDVALEDVQIRTADRDGVHPHDGVAWLSHFWQRDIGPLLHTRAAVDEGLHHDQILRDSGRFGASILAGWHRPVRRRTMVRARTKVPRHPPVVFMWTRQGRQGSNESRALDVGARRRRRLLGRGLVRRVLPAVADDHGVRPNTGCPQRWCTFLNESSDRFCTESRCDERPIDGWQGLSPLSVRPTEGKAEGRRPR